MSDSDQKQILEDFHQASVEWVAALMRADSGQDTAEQFLASFQPYETAFQAVQDSGADIGSADFLNEIKTVTENFIKNEPEGIDSSSFAELVQQLSDDAISAADDATNLADEIHRQKFTDFYEKKD